MPGASWSISDPRLSAAQFRIRFWGCSAAWTCSSCTYERWKCTIFCSSKIFIMHINYSLNLRKNNVWVTATGCTYAYLSTLSSHLSIRNQTKLSSICKLFHWHNAIFPFPLKIAYQKAPNQKDIQNYVLIHPCIDNLKVHVSFQWRWKGNDL